MDDKPMINQPDSSTEAWLNSFAPPPPKPKKPIKKFVLSAILITTMVTAIFVIIFLATQPKPCLSKSDFKDLTGAELDKNINSKDDFYTFIVKFATGSTDYSTSDTTDAVTVQKVSEFYKTHNNKSILISISGSYPDSTNADLETRRIDKINSDLISANVPSSILQKNTPESYQPDIDEGEPYSLTTVSITSADKCRK